MMCIKLDWLQPVHFTTRLFLTDLTPFTEFAISTALAEACAEFTKPLNCTTPLKDSTLIWSTLSIGSLNISALTLEVRTESSTYSPVLSRCCGPRTAGNERNQNKSYKKTPDKIFFFHNFSFLCCHFFCSSRNTFSGRFIYSLLSINSILCAMFLTLSVMSPIILIYKNNQFKKHLQGGH